MPPVQGLSAHPYLTASLPALLMALVGLWVLRPCLRRWRDERALLKALRRLGPELRPNVVLEDGVEGLAFMDYVVLTPNGIVAVDLPPYEGAVFCGERSDAWAAVAGHRTVRFPNPLPHQRDRLAALRFNLPEVPVDTLLLFGPGCTFPKGRPEGALLFDELRRRAAPEAVPASLRLEWEHFLRLAEGNARRFGTEVALVNGKRDRRRQILGGLLLVAAVGWVVAWLLH